MPPTANVYTGMLAPDDANMPGPQRAMLDATPDCIKILSVDGKLLMMNRAGCLALGIPQTSGFGMPWLPLLAEDVRSAGMAALQKAAAGETARFAGRSGSADGWTYWDNLLFPVADACGVVLSIMCVSRDVTEKFLLEQELEEAISREKLIAREMQHRIKNVFSVVSGLISISEREARASEMPEAATTLLREKLGALARASDAVFAQGDVKGADATATDLDALIRSVLKPYGENCSVVGGAASIRSDSLTTLALFLHELATNSVKYGALSVTDGKVAVLWTTSGKILELRWIETGGPKISVSAKRYGFGSEMVDRIVRSGGGTIDRVWRAEGLLIDLRIPVSIQD